MNIYYSPKKLPELEGLDGEQIRAALASIDVLTAIAAYRKQAAVANAAIILGGVVFIKLSIFATFLLVALASLFFIHRALSATRPLLRAKGYPKTP